MEHLERPVRPVRRIVAAAAALGLGLGLSAVTTAPANATPRGTTPLGSTTPVGGTTALGGTITLGTSARVGYVRLAHLSPDTPAVDVYLGPAEGTAEPQVFEAVGYGVLSPYLPLPTGPYAVAMRRAGAPADDPPVLTTSVSVRDGEAYTVAGVGRYADLGLRVLEDDLSSPADGRAKVRVVQASVRAPVIDVALADGPSIAEGVPFATTTSYHQVTPGRSTLRLSATGAKPTTTPVSLRDGTVYSLLVLDAKAGGLTTELRVDARGGVVVPDGGVDTGAGGTATGAGGTDIGAGAGAGGTAGAGAPAYPLGLAAVGALAAVVVAAATRSALRRRRTT
ncbi:DUF4397 domain-containing protein [Micromonospora sp. WMMD1102]|uniref:DUF4397 domain-containing protein n=1 Tax=Micromonospora sp. WMMD1102 TaxID=3016105 RepID=UPI002414F221|nr:DUF4397 domain-containing protein [Micromonospora sp. WMMD1102]MDG4788847.1 DUF4397 domain-containing protein [Micromonospora sp. WMMD1102]